MPYVDVSTVDLSQVTWPSLADPTKPCVHGLAGPPYCAGCMYPILLDAHERQTAAKETAALPPTEESDNA